MFYLTISAKMHFISLTSLCILRDHWGVREDNPPNMQDQVYEAK